MVKPNKKDMIRLQKTLETIRNINDYLLRIPEDLNPEDDVALGECEDKLTDIINDFEACVNLIIHRLYS